MENLYNLEIDRIRAKIKNRGSKRILLQLPDGLRPFAYEIVESVSEGINVDVILAGDSCYGACDVALRQAMEVDADLLVHYGHSKMMSVKGIPVLYIHSEININIDELSRKVEPYLKQWHRIGLVSTAQHVHQFKDLSKELTERGFEVHIGKGYGKTSLNGQILGCYYYTAQSVKSEVDVYLFIGGGQFHANGLLLNTGKPVVLVNPFSGDVTVKTLDDLMQLAKKRMAAITSVKNALKIGVLVSSKPGQKSMFLAEEIVRKFRNKGTEALVIYVDEVRPEHLNNFVEPQAFIDTACPRIAIDGVAGLNRPIVTVKEAEVALGERQWEDIWGEDYLS